MKQDEMMDESSLEQKQKPTQDVESLEREKMEEEYKFESRVITTVIIILFLAHPSITEIMFSAFK